VGHTKNPADRLFNLAKGSIHQQNVYTMTQFLTCMNNSAYVTAMEIFDHDFYDYNAKLETLYKDLTKPGVKRWQIFNVDKEVEGQQLTMIFRSSNRQDAPFMNFPIIKSTNDRNAKLAAAPTRLQSPGRKDIKQVELYTKFRKYVPSVFQEESCPKPSDEILERFKIEKTEKVKVNKQKKEEAENKRLETAARRAAELAIADMTADTRAAARNNNKKKRKNNNDVYETLSIRCIDVVIL
jgi:hypothetical protein